MFRNLPIFKSDKTTRLDDGRVGGRRLNRLLSPLLGCDKKKKSAPSSFYSLQLQHDKPTLNSMFYIRALKVHLTL